MLTRTRRIGRRRVDPTAARTAIRLALDPGEVMRAGKRAPDPWQQDLLVRLATPAAHRVLVVSSRQVGKGETASALAVHRALTRPASDPLIVSPTARQSSLSIDKARRALTALGLAPERDAATSLRLPGGGRITALPGSADSIRGYTTELLIIDEGAWVPAAVLEAAKPMLAVTGGDLVALSTPFGESGWLFEAWSSGDPSWHRVHVPWWRCPRITETYIASERAQLPAAVIAREYEAEFTTSAGGVFSPDLIAAAMTDTGTERPAWQAPVIRGFDWATGTAVQA